MSYNITLTNGTSLIPGGLSDGQIDQIHTDLTLVGKNATNYGAFFNDNFVHLLENFANTSKPNYPIRGQLWFDTSELRLKVYNGTDFATTNGVIVSSTIPSSISAGDLWIDTKAGQLYFNDGIATVLAGPSYSRDQGVSGFNVESVVDTNGVTHTIVVLYVDKQVLGVFSKDTFTPADGIAGFTNIAQVIGYQTDNVLTVTSLTSGSLSSGQTISGLGILSNTQITAQLTGTPGSIGTYSLSTSATAGTSAHPININATNVVINVGFNASSYSGILFRTTATQAISLLAANGSLKTAEDFVSTADDSTALGSLTIQNNNPLTLGVNSDVGFLINGTTNIFSIESNTFNQKFQLKLKATGSLVTALHVDPVTQRVGIYTTTPTSTLDVNGDVTIEGNLIVKGTTETINSTTVTIADKNIVLAQTQTPNDTTATGGGITVAGQSSKVISWSSTASTSSASSNLGYWNFTDFINVGTSGSAAGYYLNGQPVITVNVDPAPSGQFSLGTNVTSALGLQRLGILSSVQAGYIGISGSTISYINGSSSNGTIYFQPKGTGTVDASGSRITNIATPAADTDAANQLFVNTQVQIAPIAMGLNTTGYNNTTIATSILNKILPVAEHQNLTICRIQCSDGTLKQFQIVGGTWSWQFDIV
jgi:hypothetical protein